MDIGFLITALGLLFRWIYALAMFLCVTGPLALQITVLYQRLPRLNFFIHQLLKYVLGLNELFCMTVSSDRFVVVKATKLSIHFGGAYLQLSLTAYLRVCSRVSRLTSQSFAIKKYGLKDWFEDIESGNPISQVFVLLDRFGCMSCWSTMSRIRMTVTSFVAIVISFRRQALHWNEVFIFEQCYT